MVKISEDIKKQIHDESVIIVGTVDEIGLCNVSPRSTFYVTDDEIYWLELFKHKSYDNFKKNHWVSVAVFDKHKLSGYQLKGKVSIMTDKEKSSHVRLRIIDRLSRLNQKRILEHVDKQPFSIIQFKPNIIYALHPIEFADVPVVLDANVELGRLSGGVDIESTFGINKKSVEL